MLLAAASDTRVDTFGRVNILVYLMRLLLMRVLLFLSSNAPAV